MSIVYTFFMARKDSAFRIRVERELREEFLDICRVQDKPAAQVVREFMRDYVARGRAGQQGSLFGSNDPNSPVG